MSSQPEREFLSQPTIASYLSMWWFFFPLALTFSLITLSHTLVNASLGKFPNPEAAIAAYAVARSVMHLAQNPTMMVRQVVTSLVQDEASYILVRQVIYRLMLIMTALLILLSWTPLGARFLQSVMGVQDEALRQTVLSLRVFSLFPIISVHRNLGQGLAILARANHIVPFATVMRLLTLAGLLALFVRWRPWPGAVMGAIAFTITMMVEASVLFLAGRPARRRLRQRQSRKKDPADRQPTLTTRQVLAFYVPLMGTTLAAALTIPLVQAGIARSSASQTQLAAFAVTWALSMVITSPANMIHQSSLAFTQDGRPITYDRALRFALGIGLVLSAVTALIAFTPLSDRFLASGGATPQLVDTARRCLQVLSLLPVARAWREHCWGVLMRKRQTKSITQGKALSIGTAVTVMVIGIVMGVQHTAVLGAWSLVVGELIEGLLLHRRLTAAIGQDPQGPEVQDEVRDNAPEKTPDDAPRERESTA